jgi:acetyltransferase-like isoleucine patch superfamily enzyme
MRELLLLFSILLPWNLRRAFLEKQFGFKIHPTCRIGLSWIMPRQLIMEAHSSIGHLNMCKNISLLHLGEHALIARGNWITGFPKDGPRHFLTETERMPQLIVGRHSAITNRHLIDCTSAITIGEYSTVAGFGSQLMTHSIDIVQNRQRSLPITIGDYCFIGTDCVLLGGSTIPDFCVVGAKSLVNKSFTETYQLYGGIPARPLEKLSPDCGYFRRTEGFVT